jgi:hypothetical protein
MLGYSVISVRNGGGSHGPPRRRWEMVHGMLSKNETEHQLLPSLVFWRSISNRYCLEVVA